PLSDVRSFPTRRSSDLLGGGYAPFPLGFSSPATRDLELCVSRGCLEDRRALRQAFDQLARQVDTAGTLTAMDRYEQQAFDILVGDRKSTRLNSSHVSIS